MGGEPRPGSARPPLAPPPGSPDGLSRSEGPLSPRHHRPLTHHRRVREEGARFPSPSPHPAHPRSPPLTRTHAPAAARSARRRNRAPRRDTRDPRPPTSSIRRQGRVRAGANDRRRGWGGAQVWRSGGGPSVILASAPPGRPSRDGVAHLGLVARVPVAHTRLDDLGGEVVASKLADDGGHVLDALASDLLGEAGHDCRCAGDAIEAMSRRSVLGCDGRGRYGSGRL